MKPWLTIVGCGDDGLAGLAPAARLLLDNAALIVAPQRMLGDPALAGKICTAWPSPFSDGIEQLLARRGSGVCVLATGDPMHFGVGATLAQHVPLEEMRIIPAPSAFSLAAARLAWPLQQVDCISLHGRPAALIEPFIAPDARILALGEGAGTLQQVSARLEARGFEQSRITVLEHMGGARERVLTLNVDRALQSDIADFSTLAIECIAGPHARILPRMPGLPDEAFSHDGQLTKREVRAATLAALAPYAGALLWDVGAGCGSVAIEWMRAARHARAVAIERNEARLAMIAENALALGVPQLSIAPGRAPDMFDELATPDAIFLGGGVSDETVFDACWARLRANGMLVANAVTLEGETALIARQKIHGGELVRMDISILADVGPYRALKPRMSVLQWRVRKGAS